MENSVDVQNQKQYWTDYGWDVSYSLKICVLKGNNSCKSNDFRIKVGNI